jgi:hypothetical protein
MEKRKAYKYLLNRLWKKLCIFREKILKTPMTPLMAFSR